TSPYARKVTVTALETGLDSRIERVLTLPASAPDLPSHNPLGKVPVLILDNGETLLDSPVIVEYLDSLHAGPKVVPEAGEARWRALKLQALADGILDAVILRMMETRRPDGERSAAFMEKQKSKVDHALDWLEEIAGTLDQTPTIGQIAVAVAGDYLDFRFRAEDWRKSRPKLAQWQRRFAARPSMAATYPKEAS